MKIETASGHTILADDADLLLLIQFSWYVNRTTHGGLTHGGLYAQAREPKTGRRLYMHRLLMDAPDGLVVHHRNNNGLDNRRANLEVTTTRQNILYACEGRPCVHLHKTTGTWRAQLRDDSGKRVSLGLHPTREAAVQAVAEYRGKS